MFYGQMTVMVGSRGSSTRGLFYGQMSAIVISWDMKWGEPATEVDEAG